MLSRIETLSNTALSGRDIIIDAVYLAQRIDTRHLEVHRLGSTPLVVEAGDEGLCVLFRYGVVVFVNVTPVEQVAFRAALEAVSKDRFEEPVSDRISLAIDPVNSDRFRDGVIVCPQIDLERIQVVSDALAKSVTFIR